LSDELYNIWIRLGVGFVGGVGDAVAIDLEHVLIATTRAGREDSRLLFGMRAWLLKHHDLVNNSRLIRFIKTERETAVIGAVIDSILAEIPRSSLRYVLKHCKKAKKQEFVFRRVAGSKIQSKLNREEILPVWKRWNLISREMGEMRDIIRDRSYVLAHNRNLALRAFFGPTVKAEVFDYLLEHREANAYQMAQGLCMSYQPVYRELVTLRDLGMIEQTHQGIARQCRLKDATRDCMTALIGG
jgi:hypothetical protein